MPLYRIEDITFDEPVGKGNIIPIEQVRFDEPKPSMISKIKRAGKDIMEVGGGLGSMLWRFPASGYQGLAELGESLAKGKSLDESLERATEAIETVQRDITGGTPPTVETQKSLELIGLPFEYLHKLTSMSGRGWEELTKIPYLEPTVSTILEAYFLGKLPEMVKKAAKTPVRLAEIKAGAKRIKAWTEKGALPLEQPRMVSEMPREMPGKFRAEMPLTLPPGQGFELQAERRIPRRPYEGPAIELGKREQIPVRFAEERAKVAMDTPPFLRTAEDRLIIQKMLQQPSPLIIGKKERGSFSLKFENDKIDILKSAFPEGSEAAKANKMYDATIKAITERNAITYDKLKNVLVRSVVDVSGNLKRAVLKAHPSIGREVVMNRELLAGSSTKAAQAIEGYRKAIFDGLRGDGQEILNRVVQSRRIIAIEAYKPEIKHPHGLTGKSHSEYISGIERVFGKPFADDIKMRADSYFSAMRDQLSQLKVAGILSDESYNALKSHEYSPRQFLQHLDPEQSHTFGGRKITVTDSGIKALKEGDYGLLENNAQRLLEEVVVRTQARIFRNEANKSLYKLADTMPDNGVVKKAAIIKTTKAGEPIFQKAGAGNEKISVMVDGHKQEMIMPSEMAGEWVQNDPLINKTASEVIQWLTGAKILKAGATGYNPAFAITNLPRDIGLIWIQPEGYSKHLPIAVGQMARDYVQVLPDVIKRSGRVKDYINEGGGMQLMTHYGRFTGRGQIGERLNSVGKTMGWLGETSEIWSRIALRERGIRDGLSPKEATWQARKYLDFSQGGNVAKAVDSGLPYLNASIQGTRSIFRAAKTNPGLFTYKMAQLGTLASTIYFANYFTNPECLRQVSDREKEANFIITTPIKYMDSEGNERHLYFKIAKDYGQRVVTSLFEGLMARYFEGKFPTKQQLMAIGDLTSMTWLPPSMSAAIAYLGNKDVWTWSNIWRGPRVEAGEEYTPETSKALVAITKPLGLSPERTAGAINKILPLGNPFVNLAGGGFKMITGQLGEDFERKTMKEILTANPSFRRFAASTHPFTVERETIEEERKGETTRRFVQTRVIDDLATRYYQTNDPKIGEQILQTVKSQPIEDQDRLVNRVENIKQFANIPDRKWWLNVTDLTPEVRAKVFYTKYSKADPEKQKEMVNIAGNLKGFVTNRFIDELEKLMRSTTPP